jgi:acyl carrier protein
MDRNNMMAWMRDYIAAHLKMNREWIEYDMEFEHYGLDSRTSIEMIGELSERIGHDLDPAMIYECSSIETLAARIVELTEESVALETPDAMA